MNRVGANGSTGQGHVLSRLRGLPRFARKLARKPGAFAGAVVIILFILVALLAPYFAPYAPTEMIYTAIEQAPSPEHWLGTDELGRDILSRVIYGARISLQVGVIAVGIGMTVRDAPRPICRVSRRLGGYGHHAHDGRDVRFSGHSARYRHRGCARPRPLQHHDSCWHRGYSHLRPHGSRLDPHHPRERLHQRRCGLGCEPHAHRASLRVAQYLAPVTVLATIGVATAILSAAGLSYLGLGAQPPTPEWGAMLSGARAYLRSAWWMATFPGLAIMLVVMAFNLLGDGLRDLWDPRVGK